MNELVCVLGGTSVVASWISRWWNDPVAATIAIIAAAAALAAWWQLRALARTRRRELLENMQLRYAETGADRAAAFRQIPPLVLFGRQALKHELLSVPPPGRRDDLATQLEDWQELTLSAAHEIAASEAKFRALLWAVEIVRGIRLGAAEIVSEPGIAAARRLVNTLNDFTQLIEEDVFDQRSVLAQLHRSIAPAVKAVEPVIWNASADGRWGMRLLRLLRRAEHFNDVERVQSSQALVWEAAASTPSLLLIHDSRMVSRPNRRLERVRERWEVRWRKRYGGRRLREHVASEGRLAGLLAHAIATQRGSLDLSWTMNELEITARESAA
jgi:hypothetical protein